MTREPQRTCIGCRAVRDKTALLRLVRAADGRVAVDRRGAASGRGAYVCAELECLKKALAKGRLDHAFRRASTPPVAGAEGVLAEAARKAAEDVDGQ